MVGSVMLLLLLALPACVHTSTTSAREGLERSQLAFLAALAARDLDATRAHFAGDAVLHIPDRPPVRGEEAIGAFFAGVFRFIAASEAAPESARIARSGDLALTTGRVRNVFESPQGRVEYVGKFLLAWERRGGEWVIVLYSLSSDQPRPDSQE